MISLRKHVEQADYLTASFRALLKAYLKLAGALPKVALPADPDLAGRCKQELERSASALQDSPAVDLIDEAGAIAIQQVDEIFHANRAAMAERDDALREVVASVAQAVAGFRGNGERHESNLGQMADRFESLSRVDDATELRRRLREDVARLRATAQEMRRETEASARQFESQVAGFEQRLEAARKESGKDRLTGLPSRQEADRHVRNIPKRKGNTCVLLFDIEDFKSINDRYGATFGDKLLSALAHLLRSQFTDEDGPFRWGPDEFLVIGDASLSAYRDRCRHIRDSFATPGVYCALDEHGNKVPLTALLAFGVAQYTRNESPEELCRRARSVLDQSRRPVRR